jgi:calcineurin-like phosphoesterase family protein
MNEKIIQNYNNIISPDDIVIHLGDLSATVKPHLAEFKEILQSLNGKKILLRGNHDHLPDNFYLDAGFEVIGDHMIVGDYFFSHYPLYKKSKYCTPEEKRLIKIYEKSGCTKIIHGHTHNNVTKWDDDKFRINACVEMTNYKPLKIVLD